MRSIASNPAPPARASYAIITAAHRTRLLDGKLLAERARIDWATLLRPTFTDDVLTCRRCRGRARVLAAIQAPLSVETFLRAAGETLPPEDRSIRRTDPPTSRPAADPDSDDCQLPPPSSDHHPDQAIAWPDDS